MSRKNIIESTVHKLLMVADKHAMFVSQIHDGEESITIYQDDMWSHIIHTATGTDMASIKFIDGAGSYFRAFLAYDNKPSEMIYDHTDNELAEKICREVAEWFESQGL